MATKPYFDMKEMNTVVDEEKRTINGYDIKNTIHIGDRAIIYAENLSSCEPYMVCSCRWDNPLGMDVYDEPACGDPAGKHDRFFADSG
jgi:hypothetical protein